MDSYAKPEADFVCWWDLGGGENMISQSEVGGHLVLGLPPLLELL